MPVASARIPSHGGFLNAGANALATSCLQDQNKKPTARRTVGPLGRRLANKPMRRGILQKRKYLAAQERICQ